MVKPNKGKKQPGNPTNRKGQDTIAALRRPECLKLRIIGLSWRQIGHQLDINHETARNDVKTILRENLDSNKPETEEYRELELERLDQLWTRYFPLALGGKQPDYKDEDGETVKGETFAPDSNAAWRCLQISKRRSELMGLDMPAQAPVDRDGNPVPDKIEITKVLQIIDAEAAKKISRASRSLRVNGVSKTGS